MNKETRLRTPLTATGGVQRASVNVCTKKGADLKRITGFIKAQPVLVISFVLALVTMIAVPPDKAYMGYCNRTVLIELFALMTAVAGFRTIGIFDKITGQLLRRTGTVRRLGAVLTLICFFSAMLVTNDVALITFVPLTLLIYSGIKDEKSLILTIVLETAAANLGSMMTPVGNPQNLFLYDKYGLTAMTFLRTMLPVGAVGLAAVMLLTFLLPKDKCETSDDSGAKVPVIKTAVYAGLFLLCIAAVFRFVPDWVCLIAALAAALACDKKLLAKVDYSLLATFICFFVFVGNIARVEAVSGFFSRILDGRELIVSALLSQFISNVPAAVMLAEFTGKGTELLLGVDIGGFGTIIASLASLISFQIYRREERAKAGRYFAVFTVINFALLILLLAVQYIITII
ncbi:SLC13 family permease [Ruminococcus flavefaciens]|uniref:SLC13 family permease n=1 Tax=Ruminococcus flavefaciens TaxID=1265 RepID=UPI0002E531A9|nr:SLC13 family permease [Ruminococcus flavefaciens]